ncbi:MAG: DUF1800 domain-containing protein [Bryobacterales bacterium]|nr:DUF1800 domain-containing protein [Bryobacterales bacterium]
MQKIIIGWALAGFSLLTPAYSQSVTIATTSVSVNLGRFYPFSARVTGVTPATVAWTVALPAGATGSPGAISAGGRYTPPAAIPSGGTVIVRATSVAAPTVFATATVELLNPFPTLASAKPSTIPLGPFTLTLNGSGFVNGAMVLFDGTPLTTTFVSANKLTATGTAGSTGALHVGVMNPDPGSATSADAVTVTVGSVGAPVISAGAAGRFLDHAAFGPDAETVAHVRAVGLEAYIDEQLAAPISPYPDPGMTGFGINGVQARFFSNAVHGQDQLRQRVAFELSQIFVVSAMEENTPTQLVPYLQILQKDAFANFRQLMEDVTLSPTMGEYLDMRNNDKADPARGTKANENYARELLQLFTIGLFQLNQDGTLVLDKDKNPIPTFDQSAIENFAKVFTGWTYPPGPGAVSQRRNPPYFSGPMVAAAVNHDTTAKTLLKGFKVPAGQTPADDLKAALDNIFSHPNVGPFIGTRLIQHLVTSNPSPAYVGRVAAVFADDGSAGHVRGNLAAVVKAILLDPEAADVPTTMFGLPTTGGHLREPAFLIPSILRALGAVVNDSNSLNALSANLGQNLFTPPTVFNYFTPSYQIPPEFTPGINLLGPEFQLLSPSSAVARVNMVNAIVYGNLGVGAVIDLTPFAAVAGNPEALVSAVNQAFFSGEMPDAMQTEILRAVNALSGTTAAILRQRAQAAIYLAAASSYYSVEH